jgi:hypothetical protein
MHIKDPFEKPLFFHEAFCEIHEPLPYYFIRKMPLKNISSIIKNRELRRKFWHKRDKVTWA